MSEQDYTNVDTLLLSEFVNKRDKLTFLKAELDLLAVKIAEQMCPYNVGDIIDIVGYSHNGKKGVVKHISNSSGYCCCYSDETWYVRGVVLKKDGSESKNRFTVSEFEHRWRKNEPR